MQNKHKVEVRVLMKAAAGVWWRCVSACCLTHVCGRGPALSHSSKQRCWSLAQQPRVPLLGIYIAECDTGVDLALKAWSRRVEEGGAAAALHCATHLVCQLEWRDGPQLRHKGHHLQHVSITAHSAFESESEPWALGL
jgi:hypothetical protein